MRAVLLVAAAVSADGPTPARGSATAWAGHGSAKQSMGEGSPMLRSKKPFDFVDDLEPVAPANAYNADDDGSPIAPADALPALEPSTPLDAYKRLFEDTRAFRRDFFTHEYPVAISDQVSAKYTKYFKQVEDRSAEAAAAAEGASEGEAMLQGGAARERMRRAFHLRGTPARERMRKAFRHE